MRVLLTGATGFIGSNLLLQLLEKNIKVLVIHRSTKRSWRIHKEHKDTILIDKESNFSDLDASQIKKYEIDTLLHLAWYGVENKYRNNLKQIYVNLEQATNIFNAANAAGIKKIIGVGSQAEYGPYNVPISEDMMPIPTTIYGIAKLCTYQVLNLLCKQNNIRFSWLRLFSAYGPMDNPSWLIPMIILKLLNGETPDLTKGEQQWDYLYVDDICNAIILLANNPDAQGIFNLGSGRVNTIRSIAEKIRDLIDPSLFLNFGQIPYGSDQIMFLQSLNDRLRTLTGWSPKVEIDDGLAKTVSWFKNNAELYNY